MIKNPVEKFRGVLEKRIDLFSAKNADYGSSFEVDGLVGIVLRLGDKLMRLKKTSESGHVIRISDEGIRELFLDMGNYCDMGLMILGEHDEKNTGVSNEQVILQQGQDYSI